ncbi:hypothetical protein SAMD00019534_085610, partial [Acytostelium subglobosum LB1]|uniref:hypothetical protein n=1 Tax=Acytostelium subglobosum LB1 TaxID=1410327 RepID=UPI000644C85C
YKQTKMTAADNNTTPTSTTTTTSSSQTTSTSPFSSYIALGDLTEKNMGQLRLLNTSTFPLTYDDKFYSNLLLPNTITKLAYFNDIVVGAVSCRIDTPKGESPCLYIMTFGVLAKYRKLGIGKRLLDFVEEQCQQHNYSKITLHVQVNSEAIEFYTKHGYTITSTIPNYYNRIQPADCHLMTKLTPKK